MKADLIKLQNHGDDRGSLVVIESGREVPFDVKRVYYIYGTSERIRRGFHAHKELRQFAVVVNGSCRILLDEGKEKVEVLLGSPAEGLFIDPKVWHEMYDFSEDCVLMVLADAEYDESDYIRDYDDFIGFVSDDS